MKRGLVTICALAAGVVVGCFVVRPVVNYLVARPYEDPIRIERYVYGSAGRLTEARLSFPSWPEMYAAIERECGFSIDIEGQFVGGATWSTSNMDWPAALLLMHPHGFEVVRVNDKKYIVRKKEGKEPNQPLQRNASNGSVSNFESPARRG